MAGELGGLTQDMREVVKRAAGAQLRWMQLLEYPNRAPHEIAGDLSTLMDHLDALAAATMNAHAHAGVKRAEIRAETRAAA